MPLHWWIILYNIQYMFSKGVKLPIGADLFLVLGVWLVVITVSEGLPVTTSLPLHLLVSLKRSHL